MRSLEKLPTNGWPHRAAEGPPQVSGFGGEGRGGQRMLSPVTYPESPFLAELKPREAWGFSQAEEKLCSRILENSAGGGRGPMWRPEEAPRRGCREASAWLCY